MKNIADNLDYTQNMTFFLHNDLIRKLNVQNRKMSVLEHKLFIYICAMLQNKPVTEDRYKEELMFECKFNLNDFCDICGIKHRGREEEIRRELLRLSTRAIWLKKKDNTTVLIRLINESETFADGTARVKLSPELGPYIFIGYYLDEYIYDDPE